MKNMKKVLFLMLFLLVLGVAGMNAQVRIGGDEAPNAAAVLDLNVDDSNDGTKGLALPRVSLDNITAMLDGTTANIDGMMVYNTGGMLTAGIYYWNGSRWVALQTYGLWRGEFTCSTCASLPVGGTLNFALSTTGMPASLDWRNCWVQGLTGSLAYAIVLAENRYWVEKFSTTSSTPNFAIYCWSL